MADEGGQDHATIRIEEVELMEGRMKEMPKLLNLSAGGSSCCIFRVPPSLLEINNKAYQPHIVSIGPYHHGKENLKMIEEHKWRYLNDFICRTQAHGKKLDYYLQMVSSMETSIRNCYSETISYSSSDLCMMMLLDGFFIIELFRKDAELAAGSVPANPDDPIFNMAWVFPFLMRDLLRLENQIPYFVLQKLFDESKDPRTVRDSTLAKLTLQFFNHITQRPEKVLGQYDSLEAKHLLGLLRKSFITLSDQQIPRENKKKPKNAIIPFLQLIQSAKKLHVAGVKFKTLKADSFLDIKFRHGVLKIPQITMDDFTSSFFLNCVAFEQCYSPYLSNHITAYITFMGCLINTPSDAEFISEHKIIQNYFGTDEDVAQFFNNVGKDVAFDIEKHYLSEMFEDVNEYYRNDWHVGLADFKHTYFNSPWSFMSALAAFILLILTMIQSFFAALAYFHPPPQAPGQ